jgi:hypothetical protein
MLHRCVVAVALFVAVVHAYSTGAGSCKATNPLGGAHLTSGSSGQLSALGLQLRIGGKAVNPSTAFSFTSGSNIKIALTSTSGKKFRGVLMRIGKTSLDTTGYLKVGTDSNVQVSSQCTQLKVGGLTHKSKIDKSSVAGILSVPSAVSSLKLEVTVVVQISGKSVWYKSDYTLNAK